MGLIGGLIERLFILVGAAVFAQLPLFMRAYLYRLSGHLEELRYQVTTLEAVAQRGGKSLSEYVAKFVASADLDFISQGEWMGLMTERLARLEGAFAALSSASPWSRPYTFFYFFDREIAGNTLAQFEPGLLVTTEGIAYGLLGALIGYLLYRGGRGVLLSLRPLSSRTTYRRHKNI